MHARRSFGSYGLAVLLAVAAAGLPLWARAGVGLATLPGLQGDGPVTVFYPTAQADQTVWARNIQTAKSIAAEVDDAMGALGDISSGLFATIGILAALRQRDRTGEGQRVDIAMYDATVAMSDIVTNCGSMGKHRLNEPKNAILDPFRASDCWFVMQLVREHQLARLAELHDVAGDLEREDTAEGVRIRATVPPTVADRFAAFSA